MNMVFFISVDITHNSDGCELIVRDAEQVVVIQAQRLADDGSFS
jgi:hypothetical protein